MTISILDLFGNSGGVGRCTREMLRHFDAEGPQVVLCGQSHVVDSFKNSGLTAPNLRFANLERPKYSLRSLRIKMARKNKVDPSGLADALVRESAKENSTKRGIWPLPILVNYPQIIPPPSGRHPICLFLHDLNWRFYPGNFSTSAETDRNCRGWVARAVKVIVNSECTRDEVIEHYQCPPDKVVAAPLAPIRENVAEEFNAGSYLERLGLVNNHFYLYPGVWGLHKGHDVLTGALESSRSAEPVVVTCGLPGRSLNGSPKAVTTLRESLAGRWENLIKKGKLVVVHGVSESEMQALRDGCRAYVLPSRYEGYGFPMAEAVYHHRPAIVSDIKAHREILHRYSQYKLARLIPSGSSTALADEMDCVAGESSSPPANWQNDIKATWSWKNTTAKIISTITL